MFAEGISIVRAGTGVVKKSIVDVQAQRIRRNTPGVVRAAGCIEIAHRKLNDSKRMNEMPRSSHPGHKPCLQKKEREIPGGVLGGGVHV
jgi:hypothetical protein